MDNIKKMFIKKIIQYEESALEAELCISDGVYDVISYAYPFIKSQFNQNPELLFGFQCSNLTKDIACEACVTKLASYFAYSLTGKIVSRSKNIVYVGGLKIQLDCSLPGDVLEGDYISFEVERIDY